MSFSGGWGYAASMLACALTFAACGDDGMMGGPDAAFICATDNQCDDLVFCNGEEVCAPAAAGADARGCVAQARPCMAGQTCDEDAQECETDCATGGDADGDGVDSMDCGGNDCDDSDDTRFPGNTEICDAEGHDEDCDPMTVGDTDADGDGVIDAACCNETDDGTSMCGTDCDDTRPDVSGTAVEACDGADNDCDGDIDEGVLSTWYRDADGDDFASMDPLAETQMACEQPTGFAATRTDCDDSRASTNPGAPELCDGRDNDCDETVDEETMPVDWYRDADGDTYGENSSTPIESCEEVPGHVTRDGDCVDDTDDDPDAALINPGAIDTCDGIDNDCDGVLEGPGEDEDMDGFASMTCGGTDCDDEMATVFPGATEICNRIDDDCSSGGGVETSEDVDDDGFAPDSSSCSAVGGFPKTDCDDDRPEAYPGAGEVCNALDDDCDSGGGEQSAEDGDGDGYSPPTAACTGGFPKTDCNDDNRDINPGVTEICDLTETDDDCDGVPNQTCPSGLWASTPAVNGSVFSSYTNFCEPGYGLVGFQLQYVDHDTNPGTPEILQNLAGWCEAFEVTQVGVDSFAVGWNDDLTFSRARLFAATFAHPLSTCPTGQFVTGVGYYADAAAFSPVDGLEFQCSGLRIVQSGSAWVAELDPTNTDFVRTGETGGAPRRSSDCSSAGTFATGIGGSKTSAPPSVSDPVIGLGVWCADPQLRLGLDGGCADTTREGFVDEDSHPDVAACAGEWGVPGMRGQVPQCGQRSGDDYDPKPNMTSCTVEDLCAEGWHVCTGSADLPTGLDCGDHTTDVEDNALGFFATGQGGNGTMCTASGTNDVYGCGSGGSGSTAPASCAPLNRGSGDGCDELASGFTCPGSTNEIGTIVNDEMFAGGVLCCRD